MNDKLTLLILGVTLVMPIISHSQNWIGVYGGLNNTIEYLYPDTVNGRLVASGKFSDTSCLSGACYSFAYWDNISWHYIGDSTLQNNRIPLAYYNGKIISANFNKGYGIPVANYGHFGELNSNQWIRTDSADGLVRNLKVINGKLYALGSFNSINGVSANNVAFKDSLGWHAIDTTTWNGNGVNDIAEFNGNLYICGWFKSHDNLINRLAKWNGTTWSSVGGANFTNTWTVPFCLATYKNELYLSGFYIFKSNGDPGDGICKWNDTTWSELGTGLIDSLGGSAGANSMNVINGTLVIAGGFDFADGVPAKNIAEWDGAKFCAFGGWFDNSIDRIAYYNNQIYVSGPWKADTINVNHISRWVGGNYRDSCGINYIGLIEISNKGLFLVYPNPVSKLIGFNLTGINNYEKSLILIQNSLGETLKRESYSEYINVADLPSGCYFINLILSDHNIYRTKFIKE